MKFKKNQKWQMRNIRNDYVFIEKITKEFGESFIHYQIKPYDQNVAYPVNVKWARVSEFAKRVGHEILDISILKGVTK